MVTYIKIIFTGPPEPPVLIPIQQKQQPLIVPYPTKGDPQIVPVPVPQKSEPIIVPIKGLIVIQYRMKHGLALEKFDLS